MAQIGLKNLYYALLTQDDSTGVTYGTPKRIVGAIQVDINPTVNTNTLNADDAPFYTASSMSDIAITMETAQLPLEDRAALLGQTVSGGMLIKSGADKAPYVALLFESEKANGATAYIKLLKGRFAESQETINTKGDSIEYATPSLTGSFVAREHDGYWQYRADSDMTDADASVIKNWYASVDPVTP